VISRCDGVHPPVISTLGRMRQEDHEFKASLNYIIRHY
jgi:hypothetical protein